MMMSSEEGGISGEGGAPVERTQRVAVFVDVENVLGWLKRGGCTELLSKARELGMVSIRRAFGDFSNPTVASRQVELQRHGFDLVHTLHPAKGKSNSADISMTIDVMESCRGPDIQWVVLATGDSDFGPVFRRLRELGKGVVGVGPSSVLSSSVALSCHEFIFTDDDNNNRSGSAKKGRGRGVRGERANPAATNGGGGGGGGGATANWAGIKTGARGMTLRTRMATPPQLLTARGGFRFTRSPSGGAGEVRADGFGERGISASPLLIGGPDPPSPPPSAAVATAKKGYGVGKRPVVDWTAVSLPTTPPPPPPPQQPPSSQFDFSAALSAVALGDEFSPVAEPLLSPGQLLLPEMVTAAAAPSSPAPLRSDFQAGTPRPVLDMQVSPPRLDGGMNRLGASRVDGAFAGVGGSSNGVRGAQSSPPTTTPPPPMPPAFSGLGALSVIRPSEKLYRHLLSVESSSSSSLAAAAAAGVAGSLASDWGNGLSEAMVVRGLVSLAKVCVDQDGEHARAVEALGFFCASNGLSGGGSAAAGDQGGAGGDSDGLRREDAFRVASLLQRCGFLSWVAKEQQWLVTVPSDIEVLRRRRDETMMEELLTRCQEAGVPFDPSLAANLLWSKPPPG